MKKEMSQNRKTKIDDIQALMSSGKKQDYETALQKLKAIDNQKDFIVKYLKGLILTDLSDHFPADPPQYTQAIEELKKANKLNPDDFNILYTLARAFLGKDYLKDAEDYFIKAAELISSQNFISKGSWQEITNYFEQNNIFSNSSKNKPSELLDKWDFYLDWGRLLFKREKYTEGDLKFRIAVALCQNEYSWMIYDHWGRSVYEANINPNSAYKLFQKAFDSSPNDIQFYLYWADALSGDEYEDFETAFILYKEAANLLPGEYKVYSKWGRALFESQNYNEAIEKFSKAHELEKNDWLIYYYKGVSFLHLKKLENSISNFEIAIQLIEPKDPDISFLYQRWGQALIRIGEVIKGKDCFEKAVRLSPEKWEMFIIWGNELEELNKYDEAFVVYNNALNVSKYSGDIDAQSKSIIYESRGFCAVEMGKRSIALENFNSAKEFSNSTNLDKIISYLEDCINDQIEAKLAKVQKERDELKSRVKQLEPSIENGKPKKQKPPHPEYKNHLILTPKYRTGNKCKNTFLWYDENGAKKEGRLTDDPFDLIYYVAWLDLRKSKKKKEKKNLYFSKNVTDEHIVEIMGEKHLFGPKDRFNSNWATEDKSGRLKGQRMSDINNKIGKEIISRPETSLIINKNITVDLKPFP